MAKTKEGLKRVHVPAHHRNGKPVRRHERTPPCKQSPAVKSR